MNNEEFELVQNRANWLYKTPNPAVTITNSLILFNGRAMEVLGATRKIKIFVSSNHIKFVPTDETDQNGFSYRCEANNRRHIYPGYGEISIPSSFRKHGIALGTYSCAVEENELIADRNEKL